MLTRCRLATRSSRRQRTTSSHKSPAITDFREFADRGTPSRSTTAGTKSPRKRSTGSSASSGSPHHPHLPANAESNRIPPTPRTPKTPHPAPEPGTCAAAPCWTVGLALAGPAADQVRPQCVRLARGPPVARRRDLRDGLPQEWHYWSGFVTAIEPTSSSECSTPISTALTVPASSPSHAWFALMSLDHDDIARTVQPITSPRTATAPPGSTSPNDFLYAARAPAPGFRPSTAPTPTPGHWGSTASPRTCPRSPLTKPGANLRAQPGRRARWYPITRKA